MALGTSLLPDKNPKMQNRRPSSGDVTLLLQEARRGDQSALDRILPLIYEELRRLARRKIRAEARGHTLHATELVHEAYLKLSSDGEVRAENRPHLMAMASRAMRQLLVDHARSRKAQKRGGGWVRTTLSDGPVLRDTDPHEILALEAALETLDERQRQVVECRFFGGMEETEIAEALGVSERTVRRDWVKARAWLYKEIYPDGPEGSSE